DSDCTPPPSPLGGTSTCSVACVQGQCVVSCITPAPCDGLDEKTCASTPECVPEYVRSCETCPDIYSMCVPACGELDERSCLGRADCVAKYAACGGGFEGCASL